MNRLSAAALVASLLAAASMAGCVKVSAGSPAAKSEDKGAAIDANSVETPYSTISAGKVDIEGGLVDVAARAQGIIQDVLVQEGDAVKKDQILARQEDEDARLTRDQVAATLAQAQAQVPVLEVQLAAAQREENRLKRLADQDAASVQSYQQAQDKTKQLEAQLDAQKASINLVRAQLAEANYQIELRIIRAPADGVIVRRYASPGTGASTLQVTPLFQLQPDTQRIVRAEVEERSLTLVKVGQNVEIVPESDQTKSYPGVVMRIAEVMGSRKLKSDDPSERTDERVVEVVIDAEKAPVLVGQRVLVKFLKKDAKTAEG
ncbi:MAG: efflux RND transporter periplasmic adaptor subunit [Alphaproteobacteria bacterium]|nr:efflux RND transporter periplasmic adaptor subunit [Alphaproteobacteria bacterium]